MYSNSKIISTLIIAGSAAVMSFMCTILVAIAFIPRETVNFHDLNVDSQADVAALYQRIHTAAQHVCYAGWDKDPDKVKLAEACANEAEARAVSKVNVAGLVAYYNMKTGSQVWNLTARSVK